VRRHGPLVLSACRQVLGESADVDDAFQATFLVLVRKAGRVRWRPSIANWLYGVAHRIAVRARTDAHRRKAHEGHASEQRNESATPDLSWREAVGILHEELDRLPDRFRLPLLACYLNGQSRDEAAAQLGCSTSTLKGRLETGRKRLRARLVRRGIELSAGLLAVLAEQARGECVSRRLLDLAVQQITQPALVTDSVAALAQVALTATALPLKRIGIAAVLAVAGIGIGVGWSGARAVRPQQAEPPKVEQRQPPQAPADGETLVYSGRVLADDGRPVAGAKLYLPYPAWGDVKHPERAVSGPDGRFRFTVRQAEFVNAQSETPWNRVSVVACAPGHGMVAAFPGLPSKAADLTLRMAPDIPVKGRIVDLEGRPVPGVSVGVGILPFFQGADGRSIPFDAPTDQQRGGGEIWLVGLLPVLVSDRDGRFEMHGLGRDRHIRLSLWGPTIESSEVQLVTRPEPPRMVPGSGQVQIQYGAEFTHVASPCKPIVGVVRDKATGRPIAGVEIYKPYARATSDDQGRFRLIGLPRAAGHELTIHPAPGQPYLPRTITVAADSPGLDAVTVNIDLERRLVVRGRLTDKVTGQPVEEWVEYRPWADNPRAKSIRELAEPRSPTITVAAQADKDGRFTLPALPGRGVVLVRGNAKYRPARLDAADRTPANLESNDSSLLNTWPLLTMPERYGALRLIEPAVGTEVVTCDLTLDPGRSVTIQAVGPDGGPLSEVKLTGQQPVALRWAGPVHLDRGSGAVYALADGEPRRIVLKTADDKLAAHRTLRGTETSPLAIRLQPTGTVTGRLLDESGQSLAGVSFQVLYEDDTGRPCLLFPYGARLPTDAENRREVRATRAAGELDHFGSAFGPHRSDDQGRFTVHQLIPDLPFLLRVQLTRPDDRDPTGKSRLVVGIRDVTRVSVGSGQSKDLGDVRLPDPKTVGGGIP
jgi:RNA polymerase sigma factor (sigma-70 family)